MSREACETLSAVMDNEADELELRRVLAACGEDAELRSTWSRYRLARSVMHREPTLPKLDIAAAVSAALADEAAPPKRRRGKWRMVGLAVAASVTWRCWPACVCTTRTTPCRRWRNGDHPADRPAAGEGPAVLAGWQRGRRR